MSDTPFSLTLDRISKGSSEPLTLGSRTHWEILIQKWIAMPTLRRGKSICRFSHATGLDQFHLRILFGEWIEEVSMAINGKSLNPYKYEHGISVI